MMQRSFSIVDADDDDDEESVMEIDHGSSPEKRPSNYEMQSIHGTLKASPPPPPPPRLKYQPEELIEKPRPPKIPSPGPSGRKTVLRSRPTTTRISISESEDESDDDQLNKGADEKITKVPGEYDPKLYENLDVNEETKETFHYITKYIPQLMALDHKFKPFVPEFLPAVGDIDAFLKIIPPDFLLTGEPFEGHDQLGLTVLDEPASNQSDSALLHLQLRANSVTVAHSDDKVVVKKVDNLEKNSKTIDKWIKDISDLHKSKSSPTVRYADPMPELDDLMQEWPEETEKMLKENNFPKPDADMSLKEYVDLVCGQFNIPVKNKMHAVHLLFCLYASVKGTQLFKDPDLKNEGNVESVSPAENVPDQLVLEE